MGSRERETKIKNAPRFFAGEEVILGETAELIGSEAHKVFRVLRMKPGDELVILDEKGQRHLCNITASTSDQVSAEILYTVKSNTEPKLKITLCQALAKGDKIDTIIKSCTEVGASEFTIIETERCVVRLEPSRAAHKLERWRTIAREAAEQSNRSVVPSVNGIVKFSDLLKSDAGLKLFFYEGDTAQPLKQVLNGINNPEKVLAIIGPEGGFSPKEAELAVAMGAVSVSLGPRILRAETAGLTAISQLLYEFE